MSFLSAARTTLLLICVLLTPSQAWSEEESRFGYGLTLGYGDGITVRSVQKGTDVGDVQWLSIEPSIRLRLSEFGDGQHWYDGTLDGLIQGRVVLNFDPRDGYAGGAVGALRYTLLPGRRLRPYFEGGLGVGGLDFKLQDQADGVVFFIHATLGLRWKLNDRFAVLAGASWQHMSNAKINVPNPGIDTLGFNVGFEVH
ncbi:MAG: acyloxyacyl hydrolase [Myxococcota bacterium]